MYSVNMSDTESPKNRNVLGVKPKNDDPKTFIRESPKREKR